MTLKNVTTIQTHTKEIQRWRKFIISRAHNSEQVCVKHAQSGKLSFSNRFIVLVWTGENDAKMLRVDKILFGKRRKKVAFSNEYGFVWTGPREKRGKLKPGTGRKN